jgi:sec-independent protein translocase protein TatA
MGEGLLQPMHLLVIGFIALLIFGPSKLPELGRGLGQAIRNFKEGMKEGIHDQDASKPTDESSLKK